YKIRPDAARSKIAIEDGVSLIGTSGESDDRSQSTGHRSRAQSEESQPIVVVERIGAGEEFLKVAHSVVVEIIIGVVERRIQAVRCFPAVRHAVAVCIDQFWRERPA